MTSEQWDPFSRHAEPMALLFERRGIIPACQAPVKANLKRDLEPWKRASASCLVPWNQATPAQVCAASREWEMPVVRLAATRPSSYPEWKFFAWLLAGQKGSFPKHEKKQGLSRFLKPQSEVGVASAAPAAPHRDEAPKCWCKVASAELRCSRFLCEANWAGFYYFVPLTMLTSHGAVRRFGLITALKIQLRSIWNTKVYFHTS